ncbi:MAG: alpha/beta hydrolase [Gemmatimonadales bacterium]
MILVLAFVGVVSVFQERIAFQPQGPPYPSPGDTRREDYRASDGQPLFAYIVGDPANATGLLLVFHGNADMAARQIDWARDVLSRTGLAVMVAEYRGYASLAGKPSYVASQLDADAAYAFAIGDLHVPADRIAFFGHSLGTAVAAELATRHRPFALVLQSPFTSARDMARLLVGRRPGTLSWNLFSRIHFDTIERVKTLDVPVSVAHGGRDRLISSSMGLRVFEAAHTKGQWLLVPEASHNDVSTHGEAYWKWLTQALASRTGTTSFQ